MKVFGKEFWSDWDCDCSSCDRFLFPFFIFIRFWWFRTSENWYHVQFGTRATQLKEKLVTRLLILSYSNVVSHGVTRTNQSVTRCRCTDAHRPVARVLTEPSRGFPRSSHMVLFRRLDVVGHVAGHSERFTPWMQYRHPGWQRLTHRIDTLKTLYDISTPHHDLKPKANPNPNPVHKPIKHGVQIWVHNASLIQATRSMEYEQTI